MRSWVGGDETAWQSPHVRQRTGAADMASGDPGFTALTTGFG